MKATCGMLTYKTHLDKELYRLWLEGQFARHDLKIAIAHETGDETNEYPHTHVVVHFGKSITISNKRVQNGFDYRDIHPHWKRGVGRGAFKDMLKYISKEDEDIGIEVERGFGDIIEEVWSVESEADVIRLCRGPADVIPFLQIYKHKLLAERHALYHQEISEIDLSEDQQKWWSILRNQNDRKVLWIVDYVGELGKSTFGKWLRVNHGGIRLGNNTKDSSFVYSGEEYVYFNFTRSQEERVSYQVIEELKDGDIFCGKYEGKSILYAPPKIIVFSNFAPDRTQFSADRWCVLTYGERPAMTNIQYSR